MPHVDVRLIVVIAGQHIVVRLGLRGLRVGDVRWRCGVCFVGVLIDVDGAGFAFLEAANADNFV